MTRYLCVFVLLCATLGFVACDGSTSEKAAAFCSANCSKLNECDLLFGASEASCNTACKSGTNSGSSDCEPSSSEIDACVSAIKAATCSEIQNGFPAACDFCPDNSPDASNGTQDSFTTPDIFGGSGTCSDLADCCSQLPSDQKDGCNQLVSAGDDGNCAATLTGFQIAGLCN